MWSDIARFHSYWSFYDSCFSMASFKFFSHYLVPKQSHCRLWWMTLNQVFFCQKQNTFSRNICSSYSVSYKSKFWSWNVLIFSTIRLYCYRKQAWLSAFLFCNFIVELAVIHAILKNIWCMVLSYHMLHYFWYKQPLVFKLSNFCIGNRFSSRVGSDTCDIEKHLVYGVKLSQVTLLLVQTTICFQIVKFLHR